MPRFWDISLDGNRLRRRILWCDRTALFFFVFGLLFNVWVVARWAGQPLLDQHYFRQTQTAMTAWWLVHQPGLVHWVDYETPIFGSPWQIPLEFPLFQWCVALVCLVTGLPLDLLGRCLSALFFYATLGPLWMLARDFGLNRRAFFLAAGLLLLSPVYLYWSRCFLIESTALFFSLLYLACVKRYLGGGNRWWLLLLPVAGAAGVLTKVTTFAPFAACACLMLVVQVWRQRLWKQPIRGMTVCLPPLASLVVCSLVIVLWLRHTESRVQSSYFGSVLTPGGLHSWNYGSLAQRTSLQLWRDTIWQRATMDAVGSRIFILLLLIPNLGAKPRVGISKAVLVALFLLPFLWFTNLHIVHNYYQYANALFLVLAVALGLWQVGQINSPVLLALLCALAAFAEIGGFCRGFLHSVRMNYSDDALLRGARVLREQTPSNSVLLIAGCEWNPALAYYSERRSIYIPSWATREQVDRFLRMPDALTAGLPLSAIVDYPGRNPPSGTELWDDFLNAVAPGSVVLKEGPYRIYLPQTPRSWEWGVISKAADVEASAATDGAWTKSPSELLLATEKIEPLTGKLERVELGGRAIANLDKPLMAEAGSELRLQGWFQPRNGGLVASTAVLEICGIYSWSARCLTGTCSVPSDVPPGHEPGEKLDFNFTGQLPARVPEDTYQVTLYQSNAAGLFRLDPGMAIKLVQPWMDHLPPEWPEMAPASPASGNLELAELDGKRVSVTSLPLVVNPGAVLKLFGWSADVAQDATPPERLLALRRTGNAYVRYVPVQNWARPDVAQSLGNPRLQEAGFRITCTVGPSVPAGIYRLELIQKGSRAQFKMPLSLDVRP